MNAICLILIGLMTPTTSGCVESIPREVSFVVREDGDLTQWMVLRNGGDEPVILDLTYKPFNIDVDASRRLEPDESVDVPVVLRVPEGTWAEVQEIYGQIRDRRQSKGKRRYPPMTMISKLAYLVSNSRIGEPDTVEIRLRLRYDFEPEGTGEDRPYLDERPY